MEEEEKAPSAFVKGTAGAVLGAAAGVVIWCICGALGYVWPYIGVLMGIGISLGYMKFAGGMDLKGVSVCVTVLIIGLYIGLHMCYAVSFYDWRPDLIGCILHLYTYLDQYDMLGRFLLNLLLTYVFGFIGISGIFKKIDR